MPENLPLRDEEPTLGLIRELRDAVILDEPLMARALTAKRPEHTRRIDAVNAEPTWDDLQILTAQLATKPLVDSVPVDTKLVLGLATRQSRQTLAHPLLMNSGTFDPMKVAALRVDSRELQEFTDAHATGADGVRALSVHVQALAQHRAQLSASELPFGVRVGAGQIEHDLTAVVAAGADFVILDAGTAAIRALAEARACLTRIGAPDGFAIVVDGELRVPNDFIKALALGATGVVVADSTLATIFKLALASTVTSRDLVENFVHNALQLMTIMARACGHDRFSQFGPDDLTTWLNEVALVSGVARSGHTHTE